MPFRHVGLSLEDCLEKGSLTQPEPWWRRLLIRLRLLKPRLDKNAVADVLLASLFFEQNLLGGDDE